MSRDKKAGSVQPDVTPIDTKGVVYHEVSLEEVIDDILEGSEELHDNLSEFVHAHEKEHLHLKVNVADLGEKIDRLVRFCQTLDGRLDMGFQEQPPDFLRLARYRGKCPRR